jgi:hypothetical protein
VKAATAVARDRALRRATNIAYFAVAFDTLGVKPRLITNKARAVDAKLCQPLFAGEVAPTANRAVD